MAQLKVTNIFKHFKYTAKPSIPVPSAVWQDPLYFIGFGLGSGTMPFAPGTFGTLMAIPFYLMLRPLPGYAYLIFVFIFIIFSSLLCGWLSKEIRVNDHPGMCIDEFAGFFVTMINAPHGFFWIILGFILFRLFDIWKPWPISFIDQKIHGGFGMVLDDVLAGIYGCIIIQLLSYFIT